MLFVAESSESEIREFLVNAVGVRVGRVVREPHLTVYHARRKMDVHECEEKTSITIPSLDFRFMLMAPGGENPRSDPGPDELADRHSASKAIGAEDCRVGLSVAVLRVGDARGLGIASSLDGHSERLRGAALPATRNGVAQGERC